MSVRERPVTFFFGLWLGAVGAAAVALWHEAGWHPAPAWITAANLAALPLWGWDKMQARRGGFRVPENALHLAALAGAVPGSFLAMRLFRHKTLKPRFRALWVVFLVLQVAALALWLEPRLRPW